MSGADRVWPTQGQSLHKWLARLSTLCAALGGVVIFISALITTGSVVFRAIGMQGFSGSFELMELACAACAGLFLPLCQLQKGHVTVEIFTSWMPAASTKKIDTFWSLAFAVAWAVLCYLTFHGAMEIYDYGDRTMLMGVPVWWIFVPAMFGMALSSLIALLSVFAPVNTPVEAEVQH